MHDDDLDHVHLGGEAGPIVYVGEEVQLLSVGVDIGSSTSHLVFSRLVLERQGHRLSSQYRVSHREIIYRSPVALTPYASARQINPRALQAYIHEAFEDAGIDRAEVDAGAVIMTGEAALKENARPILDLFAAESGRFVGATAGPNLESLLAANGSGAVELSRQREEAVLNIDIGGGTTKFAVCLKGKVTETSALHVGARLLAWGKNGSLMRVEDAGRRLAEQAGVGLERGLGHTPQPAELDALADLMAEVVLRVAIGEPLEPWQQELWITAPLTTQGPFKTIVFSGGVSEYVYGREQREFGDLGPRLGAALLRRAQETGAELAEPREGIRATCIGASQYTVQLSGDTIFLSDHDMFPLRNLPVAAVRGVNNPPTAEVIRERVTQAVERLDLQAGTDSLALAVHWHHGADYPSLRALAEGIATAIPQAASSERPLLVAIDYDVAGIVGSMLQREFGFQCPLVCIDQIALREFDYVDVGSVLPDRGVVPVVIKSLVFH